jgi:hypothetical protein
MKTGKDFFIILLLGSLLTSFSGCITEGVHIKEGSVPNTDIVNNPIDINAAIVVTKKMSEKYYHLDGTQIYLYPALIDTMANQFRGYFKSVKVIKEDEYMAKIYSDSFNLYLIPDWEIETRNLNIKIETVNNLKGNKYFIESTAIIKKEVSLKHFYMCYRYLR